jgi:polyhydroxyalkanoate synthesis regulator phasin
VREYMRVMRRRLSRGLPVAALALGALAVGVRAQDDDPDDDTPARLRAELRVVKHEVSVLKARVAQLEAQVAALSTTVLPEKAEVTRDLGFVFPGMPRGSVGAEGAGDVATGLYQKVGRSPQEVEALLAFKDDHFVIPESLWTPAAKGLKTVVGLPTRDEIELVLRSMKPADMNGSLGLGFVEVLDAEPSDPAHAIRVIEMTIDQSSGKTETYRLTTVRIGGPWFAAHLFSVSAEKEARDFLDDLVRSQRSYHQFYQVRYAKNLHELADDREKLEKSDNIKRAGLTFPLGAHLDRLQAERLEWTKEGDLRSPFYRFHVTGDEARGWRGDAVPRSPSYPALWVEVPASAAIGDPVTIQGGRSSEPGGK